MDMLLGPLVTIGNVFICAIPARYRQWWPVKTDEDLRGAAIASGALEFLLGALSTLMYVGTAISVAKGGFGVLGLVLNPFLPFVWLFAEGAVRLLAALSSGQVLATLPLQIIVGLEEKKEGKQVALQLGPLVADKIARGEGKPWDLLVLSCRAKSHWNPYMTTRFEDVFYQMIKEDLAEGRRKYVYLLRKHPENRLVVVVYEYDPNEVMTPNALPRRWTPTSG